MPQTFALFYYVSLEEDFEEFEVHIYFYFMV